MCGEGGSALATVMIENERVKVTEWRFKAKGDSTGWHRHAFDFIFVPLFDGVLDVKLASGEVVQAPMQNGVPAFRDLGIEHVLFTELEVEKGYFTGKVIQPTCFGEGKVMAAESLAATHGVDLGPSFFYSDSDDDNFTGAGNRINRHIAVDIFLGQGHEEVARPHNNVNASQILKAIGHGGNRLRPTCSQDRFHAKFMAGRQHMPIL